MPTKKKATDFKEEALKGKKGGHAMSTGGMNPMVGAAMGAIAGAAVGAVATYALSDDKTREKATEIIGNVRDKATERLQDMTKEAKSVASKAATKAADSLPEIKLDKSDARKNE